MANSLVGVTTKVLMCFAFLAEPTIGELDLGLE